MELSAISSTDQLLLTYLLLGLLLAWMIIFALLALRRPPRRPEGKEATTPTEATLSSVFVSHTPPAWPLTLQPSSTEASISDIEVTQVASIKTAMTNS